jgi:3-hydroxyisobutyrate dehydrogenase-like beta-hydroxyacid dehydrogenase
MLTALTVGWIGRGKMGRPMSQRVSQAGARVLVSSRNRTVVDEMVGAGLESMPSRAQPLTVPTLSC